jgi:hypothetical protein
VPCCRRFKPIDEIHNVAEPSARAVSDAGPRDRDGKVALSGPGTVDEQNVALPRNERPSGQISNERFIDWRASEVEVIEVFGERQLCRRELVF